MTSGERGATRQGEKAAADGGESTHARTLARLVRGTNINETTFLATDYLNHFNEVIMLLDMIPEMPDCLEDAKQWRPRSYAAHFQESCFRDKDLAIFAYENAPPRFRAPFDSAVETMNGLVEDGLSQIEAALAGGDPERVRPVVESVCDSLRRFVDLASAIIHGQDSTVDQDRIDAILQS